MSSPLITSKEKYDSMKLEVKKTKLALILGGSLVPSLSLG